MAGPGIELILARSLAGSLSVPASVVDAKGTIVWFNDPAERLLGRRAEETLELDPAEIIELLDVHDTDGKPLNPNDMPSLLAVKDGLPHLVKLLVNGADGTQAVRAVALPLATPEGTVVGALVTWYREDPS